MEILFIILVGIMLITDFVIYDLTAKERIKIQKLREELIEYEKKYINK